MRIGVITDNCSHYWKQYPHQRDVLPIYKYFIDKGHDVVLINPVASKTVMNNFSNSETKTKLNEAYTWSGIRPLENEDTMNQEFDILYVNQLPWMHRFNLDIKPILEHYLKKSEKIIWQVMDYEIDNPKNTWLWDIVVREFPEVLKKITVVTIHIGYVERAKAEYGLNCVYLPRLYHEGWQDVDFPTERGYFASFVGPVGFRTNMLPYVDGLYHMGHQAGIESHFYGESYAEKYRDSRVNMFYRYQNRNDKFVVHDERIFFNYPDYKNLVRKSLVHLHDSIVPGWLGEEVTISPYYSHKIYDALYSCTLPVTTPFYWYEQVYDNKEIRELLVINPNVEINMKNIDILNSLGSIAHRQIFYQVLNGYKKLFDIKLWSSLLDELFTK